MTEELPGEERSASGTAGSRRLFAGPVKGKTYSLYGAGATTDGYFDAVSAIVEASLRRTAHPTRLIEQIAAAGSSPRRARRASAASGSEVARACREAERLLGPFFEEVESHRASLSIRDRCSGILAMSREQYLLASVEIGLRNRLNAGAFDACAEKLAFLPHCLRDLETECAAKPQGLDTVCMACSEACYVNAVSRLLRRRRVRPYIWMSADLKRLLREKADAPGGLGILGIACIPELVAGMRLCARARVPVVGLPLDANRCARWFGEFRPTTVSLERLASLLAGREEGGNRGLTTQAPLFENPADGSERGADQG